MAVKTPSPANGRYTFARIPEPMEMPYLLETQKLSYSEFLQMNAPADVRDNRGLQEVFKSVFPIQAANNPSNLEFVEYNFGAPKYSVRECIERGMTYAVPLKVKLQLIIRETDEATGVTEVKDIKEQETYMGEIPLMTEQGTFIINGAERVIVSQLHRSPGVSFNSGQHSNGKTIYSSRIIPYRGAWVEFEIDINNLMWVMIDRKRKIPATTFLRAFGQHDDTALVEEFFQTESVNLDDFSKGATKTSDLDQYVGEELIEEVIDPKSGKKMAERGAKVTKKLAEQLKNSEVKKVFLTVADAYAELLGRILGEDVVDTKTGEVIGEYWERITTAFLRKAAECKIGKVKLLAREHENTDTVLQTIEKDKVRSTEEALIEFFKKMRPGNPVSVLAGRRLMDEMFFSEKRYDLGLVGRFKINRTFKQTVDPNNRLLTAEDIVNVMKQMLRLQRDLIDADDIDHLGNRRVRSVGELLQNQIRVGLAELEKTARERMAIIELENLLPHNLINAKPVVSAIKDFFGRSQLSQFMDQTNPLSELTHKRRLSALGPGGLSRDRAGFEVRDVHYSHYGRICPIETPEGPNIGLISSLSTYARINQFGFIETPYIKVKNGKVTNEIEYMTADIEDQYHIAQANEQFDIKTGKFQNDTVLCRYRDDYPRVAAEAVDYMDVSPKQLVSVSASLIPFLEHDDANRALMGSNMQRQGVPLLYTDSPVVGTGVERKAALDSGVCAIARNDGTVARASAEEIIVRNELGGSDHYPLRKFQRSNQNTCMNQKPIVKAGDKVKAGDVMADGPATDHGELALGKNLLVAFMPWGGYNFEDAILLSERLVRDDVFTSIHIEEFEIDARDTKLGKEEITRDIPNVSEDALGKLDPEGLVYIGAEVVPGDILVGKVTPKGETELTSEEKLLRAIFGEKAGDVRDASLKVPPGTEGTVIDIKVFSRKERGGRTDRQDKQAIQRLNEERDKSLAELWSEFDQELKTLIEQLDRPVTNYETGKAEWKTGQKVTPGVVEYVRTSLRTGMLPVDGPKGLEIKRLFQRTMSRENELNDQTNNKVDRIKTGDELPPGVNKLVKVYLAQKRKIQVGDKMAGRHGNKGVVARVLPIEDMPYMTDGTPIDIVLNPLGVPSRMNVGQILETHLGWAAASLGMKVATPVFDGAGEPQIKDLLEKARNRRLEAAGDKRKVNELEYDERMLAVNPSGQVTLTDASSGEPFERKVTVGIIYMMKLAHLVDDKMHARSIGPYSLVTQQPLGGKAQFGGQRFGEMEVWALEAYGASHTLQELLTVKSDDVQGRTRIYEAIVKGQNTPPPGVPESFNVLVKELQGLCLNLELLSTKDLEEQPDAELESDEDLGGLLPASLLADDDDDEGSPLGAEVGALGDDDDED
jgi:DNA-directed RNA polymerase subunit beta